MILFDSNVWIAFYSKNDSLHEAAEKIFTSTTDRVGIPEYILVETCSVLKQRVGKTTVDEFLDQLEISTRAIIIPIDESLFFSIRHYFRQEEHKGLSFTDVSLLYLAHVHTIVTFDKQLASAIKKAGRG